MSTAKVRKLKPVERRRGSVGRREGDRYALLFEQASDAIMVVDLDKECIAEANGRMADLTGYLKEELEGGSISLITPTEEKHRVKSFGADILTQSGFFEEAVIRGKDGYAHYVSLSVRVMMLEGRTVAMCILRDVGQRKAMERDLIAKHQELRDAYVRLEKANAEMKAMQETLVQSGKLAALGELAAGIAHELNQPLTAIKGFAQEALAEPASAKEHLQEIVKGAGKMERIISHLRGFTRRSTEDYQWTDVREVVEESLKMLAEQFRNRGIAVEKSFSADVPKVWCNPFQLEQVFINFATNARDAIEAKKNARGQVRIKIDSITAIDSPTAPGKPVPLVQVRFEDNGVGISDANKAKIFNPFFTTKEVGKGMGLGLSISYGILSKINASIFVESQAGKGTTFTVRIPVDYRTL